MAIEKLTTGNIYNITSKAAVKITQTVNGEEFTVLDASEGGNHMIVAIAPNATVTSTGDYVIKLIRDGLINVGVQSGGGGGTSYTPNSIVVNTVPLDGSPITAPNGKILLFNDIPTSCNLSGITLETIEGVSTTCELVLDVATAPTTVIFPSTWVWLDNQNAPNLAANTTYNITIRFDGVKVIANLAYKYSNQ